MPGPPADLPLDPTQPGKHPPLASTAPYSNSNRPTAPETERPDTKPQLPTSDPAVPSLPGYEVGELIGEGGMGLVFRAFDRTLNRPTALKVLHRAGPADLARFLAEAEATAAVDHPNVVRVYAYGEVGGRAYLATELCGGGTLADRLRSGPVDPREAAALVVQVGRGVAAVHALGIVHRDLKPSNVLFDGSGVPKVADFGVAKRAASDLTRTDAVMGTPAYMAPEQARGHAKSAGPAADVWALGVILYECLTGVRPFDDPDSWVTRQKVLRNRPTPPHCLVPTVPRDLEQICLRCLTKSPAGRYPTARELADDLDRFLVGEPVWARRVLVARRVYQLSRRKPVLIASGVLFALTIGLAAGWAPWWRAQRTEPTPPVDDTTRTGFDNPKGVGLLPEPPGLFVPFDVSAAVREIESLLSKWEFEAARRKIEELVRYDPGEAKRLRAKLAEYQVIADKRAAVIELNTELKLLHSRGEREEARKRLPKLRELEKSLADYWEEQLREQAAVPANVTADNRLRRAREFFVQRRLPEGLAILEDILRTSKDKSTRQTADTLKTAWGLAQAVSVLPVTNTTQLATYRELMPDPASYFNLSAEDRTDLTSFYRIDLALKIHALPRSVDVPEAPRLLAEAGRELFRNRRKWATAGLPKAPAAVAAVLFERAVDVTKRADDLAWAGICLSEVPGTKYVILAGYRDLARDRGESPATLVLAGLVAARAPWRDPGTWPDRAAELAALREAREQFRKAIKACKADKGTDRTDELLLLYDRMAAITARLAEEETDPKKKAALWDDLDALAKDFGETLPGRPEGVRYTARALEGRAPALSAEGRFGPTGAYARADQMYASSGGLSGAPPDVLVSRGRNLLKWTTDEYIASDRTGLQLERLNQSEQLLRAVTDRKDVDPAVRAEAHYQLGKAALLWYEDQTSKSEKSKLLAQAMGSFRAALDAADKLDEDPWTEVILRTVYDIATARSAPQADRKFQPDEAEAMAKFLDELADRKGQRTPTRVWQAALRVRAIRMREGANPKAKDWFQKVRDAAEEVVLVPGVRDCEADLRLELLVALSEGLNARVKHSKHYDPGKAAEFAREAVKLSETRPDLPARLRADALGTLGLALYRGDPEGRAEARSSLERALALLPAAYPVSEFGLSPGWRWRYALGYLDVLDAAAARKDDLAAANLAVRAMNRLLPMRPPLYQLMKSADADPDDKAIAVEFFSTEATIYKAFGNYWQKVIASHKDDPRRHAWRLAAAELTFIISDPEKRKTEVKNLAAAVKEVSERLKELPPDMKAEVEAQIARVKHYLPAE